MVPVAVVKVILGIEHRINDTEPNPYPVLTFNFGRKSLNIAKVGIKLTILPPLKLSLLRSQTE